MKYLIYLLAIVFILGLNVGLFAYLKIGGVAPNLLLIFVMLFSLEKDSYDFFFIALISGIFLDFYSVVTFGSFSIALVLLAYFLHLFVNRLVVFESNWKYLLGILAGSLLLVNIIIWLYSEAMFKLDLIPFPMETKLLLNQVVMGFIYNLLLLYPMYRFTDFVQRVVSSLSYSRVNKRLT